MSLFNFREEEFLAFFAVLVRMSALFSVLPFIGDKLVPPLVKVLLAISTSIVLFPALVASKQIYPADAHIWGQTVWGITSVIGAEVLIALLIGFTARLVFESISFSANLMGTFMGLGAATTYDPHHESQTEVIAQIQTSMAMLLFLTLDGHHLMLQASLDSFRVSGVGKFSMSSVLAHRLIHMTGEVVKLGIKMAAPVTVSIFAVNVAFGVISKAMPQLNILVLSLAATALLGLIVLYFSLPGLQDEFTVLFSRVGDWIRYSILVPQGGK